MAVCNVCGKKKQSGNHVSHANNKTKRSLFPNLQRVRIIADNNQVKTVMVCTQCLRSGKIRKAPVRNLPTQAG